MDNKLLLVLLAAVAIFYVVTSSTVTAQRPLHAADEWEFLEAHNEARASVGVEPLTWSSQLANMANSFVWYQSINMACQSKNLTQYIFKYGNNQVMARGLQHGMRFTPREAVEGWVSQKQYYNHASNSCVTNQVCWDYTQVVWRKSLELGCAQAPCVDEHASLTACFYNPPGNYIGQSPY